MSDLQKYLAAGVAAVTLLGTFVVYGHEYLTDRAQVDELAAEAERMKIDRVRRQTRTWVCRTLREEGKIQLGDCPPLPDQDEP